MRCYKPDLHTNHTNLVLSYPLQWGFHIWWISADLKTCWTTHATSTSTRRRASQSASGGSFLGSRLVLKDITCTSGTGGCWVKRTSARSICLHETTPKNPLLLQTQAFLFVILSPSSSPAPNCLCVSQAHAPCQPMGGGRREKPWVVRRDAGRRPSCYYLPPWQLWDQVGGERQDGGPWADDGV